MQQTLSTSTFTLCLSFGEHNPMVRVIYYPTHKVEYKPLCRVREWLIRLSWGSEDANRALEWLDQKGRLNNQSVPKKGEIV